jgi:hypothetical protein
MQEKTAELPTSPSSMGERMMEQALDLWINPEVERRRRNGLLGDDFQLHQAQVIFPSPLDQRGKYVRLNEEVSAVAKVEVTRALSEGEPIYERDIKNIELVQLTKDDEPNAGHLTIIRFHDHWFIGFDFTYNRVRSMAHLEAAEEFLTASRSCQQQEMLRAAAENLFAAAELAAEAELLMVPRKRTTKHIERAKRLHSWVELGNAPAGSDSALYALAELRGRARYLEAPFEPSQARFEEHERAVEALMTHVRWRLERETAEGAPQGGE